MKRIILYTATLMFSMWEAFGQPQHETQWWFTDWHGNILLRHRISVPKGTTDLLKKSSIGDFSEGFETKLLKFPTWDFTFDFQFESWYGGFKNNRAKIYAIDYLINISWKRWLTPEKGLYLEAGLLHRSTHPADSISASSIDELSDLREIRLDVEDMNLLRIGLGWESENIFWNAGIQPWRINYFLFAQADQVFRKQSYVPYEKRIYWNGFLTLWRNDTHRIGAFLEGQLESGTQYLGAFQYSTRLGETPRYDQIQLFVAYEGGFESNQVKTTPHNGISSTRWLLGLQFVF